MLEAVSRIFAFLVLMFRLIKHRVRLTFAVIRFMWVFHDRLLEIVTPKYFALVTASRTWPCNMYTVLIMSLAVVTRTIWHLEGLNFSHRFSHINSLSRSVCGIFPSSETPNARYTAVSSAKRSTCDDSSDGGSFINKEQDRS